MNRVAQIKKVSYVGIGANLLLVGFKAFVGLVSGSIAIILDAVNNLTDALTSGITILGVVLAGKKPDSRHPFGYGRIEYLTAVIISALVLFAGITSAVESAKRIANPEPADYTWVTIVVIVGAIIAKLFLGNYQKNQGKALDSDSLVATGTESRSDAALSASTLVAIAVSAIWGISIEGYVGVVISAIIIKAGVELMLGSLSIILGKRAQGDLAKDIKSEISAIDGVLGVYDLILHDYGPNAAIGTVHVEVDDNTLATQIHRITKRIQQAVYDKFHILLTVGIYARNNSNPEVLEMMKFVRGVALNQNGVTQVHGFFWENGYMSFDIVVNFDADVPAARNVITQAILERIPGTRIDISIDKNYTE